jgi:hypothetical protein
MIGKTGRKASGSLNPGSVRNGHPCPGRAETLGNFGKLAEKLLIKTRQIFECKLWRPKLKTFFEKKP